MSGAEANPSKKHFDTKLTKSTKNTKKNKKKKSLE